MIKAIKSNNFLKDGESYTLKELYNYYNGEFLITESIKQLCLDYKKGNFDCFYYKIMNNKLYLRIFCPINLNMSNFNKNLFISSMDLKEIKITNLKKISSKITKTIHNIPQTEYSIEILNFFEDYELDFIEFKNIPNLKIFMKNNNIFNTNQFVTDILFCKLYEEGYSKKLLLDYMGNAKIQYHKENLINWFTIQESYILNNLIIPNKLVS